MGTFRTMVLATAVLGALMAKGAMAAPAPEQTYYWWQDEIRRVAFELEVARSGKPAQWPAMSVAAGEGVLPVTPAGEPIRADGRLDEPCWQTATRFPIGPLFDDWAAGPFTVQVRVLRDKEHLYLALESPRSLAELRALSRAGELLTVGGQPYYVGAGGNLVERAGNGRFTVEAALPVQGPTTLAFAVEMLRRPGGRLPGAAAAIGLDRLAMPAEPRPRFRRPTLWLEPIAVKLLPGKEPVQVAIGAATGTRSVRPWLDEATVQDRKYSLAGFVYREPVEEVRREAQTIAQRAGIAPVAAVDPGQGRIAYCQARELRARAQLALLDAPLLLVKQHPYFAGHIYDDFYTWHPGGGIYVIDRPQRWPGRTIRPVIDPATNETLGEGVYRDPDISWDGGRLVFAHKGTPDGVTSLFQIGLDGRGLRRLTSDAEHSDIQPAWLPDDRIVFISTRPRALVPCFNSGVGTLHTVRADGSGLESISVNNVTEFDPAVMPDGRILYGRWEYVDKTALYMQSLWTTTPDGRMEEALFGNNVARPTAILDARPVPGSHAVVASLTPHNGQATGAIGMIDPRQGKNCLEAIFNFTPEYPAAMDQGLAVGPCDPYPLSADDLLVANNAIGAHGIIELLDRWGARELVACDPEISCYAPMLVKARPRAPVLQRQIAPGEPGRFLLSDVYQGLEGVARGTVKRLRIVEETARTSGIPPGGRWWNQAFLVSWQGAYIVKNILGTVPVHEDGSAYFEAPPGRALYFEALDADGREVQRMRTFVQAAPGVTRTCIGCHEPKYSAPPAQRQPLAALGAPDRPRPESWGSGLIDYPTMIQPVFDKHCVRCHGGAQGIAKGLDLSGGWTWAFNIGYETLVKNRLVGFLNCHNSSVHTAEILRARSIGSGAAPLAEILLRKHPEVSRAERELVFAWMDTNSNYHGSWDYTPYATCDALPAAKGRILAVMRAAGCATCHAAGHVGSDWINLQTPQWSRILRAPMAKSKGGLGLAMCRQRKATPGYPLVNQSVQPPDVLKPSLQPPYDPSGEPVVSFASADDPHYRELLAVIRQTRTEALAQPRIDMPGAEREGGRCRMQVPPPTPQDSPEIAAAILDDGEVELSWTRGAETIGLEYEIHRGAQQGFAPAEATRLGLTTAGRFIDVAAPDGRIHYALVVAGDASRARPSRTSVEVPPRRAPAQPVASAHASAGEVEIRWDCASPGVQFDVYRREPGASDFVKRNAEPVRAARYNDAQVDPGRRYAYRVVAIGRRGQPGEPSAPVEATPAPWVQEPVFTAFATGAPAARLSGGARLAGNVLRTGAHGMATFEHVAEFDLRTCFSVECWVLIEKENQMPVVLSCGAYNGRGWFLQRFGRAWRWHLGGVSCDGGQPRPGRWTHLAATFDGRRAALYQDGQLVRLVDCAPDVSPWSGPLVVGQYSHAAPPYQVEGQIGGLKIYRRALRADEALAAFRAGPPK